MKSKERYQASELDPKQGLQKRRSRLLNLIEGLTAAVQTCPGPSSYLLFKDMAKAGRALEEMDGLSDATK